VLPASLVAGSASSPFGGLSRSQPHGLRSCGGLDKGGDQWPPRVGNHPARVVAEDAMAEGNASRSLRFALAKFRPATLPATLVTGAATL
jgi:hypothetical protein